MTEAICLVIDTGATASQRPPGGRSFLEAALECASLLVERRLFAESKDEFAVVMFGSEDTNNNLSYENINVLERGLAVADWELVSFLREHVSGTSLEPDWMDGVIVALDFLKSASENKKYSSLKIVLFSEVGCPSSIDQEQLEFIINGIKNLDNVDFSFFGPDWADHLFDDEDSQNGTDSDSVDNGQAQPSTSRGEPTKGSWKNKLYKSKQKTRIQEENEIFLKALVNVSEGFSGSMNCAVESFIFKNKKGKKPTGWKVCFTLGPDIRINTTGYVLLRRESPKQWKRCLAKGGDEEEELRPETHYHREKEGRVEEVDQEDVVMGYRYGNEIVSLTEQDEAAVKFEGGPKSMSLFGFLSRDQVRIQDLVGDGCMVFMPTEADGNSQRAWAALVQAMLELNMVMVVRKVYSKASAPRLGALVPEYNDEGELILCHVELPFAEDIKDLQLPSLPAVNKEQENVMDSLIEQSMLCDADDDGEAVNDHLPVHKMLSPNTQYTYQALRHRATQPGRIIPPPAEHILDLLRISPQIEGAVKQVHEDMKEVFNTKVNEKIGNKRKRKDDEFVVDETKKFHSDDGGVTEVGPINPVDDFRYLLAHCISSNTTFDSLAQQLEAVLMRLLSGKYSASITTKIVACLSALREESCHRHRPEVYNNFVRKVKEKCEGENQKILLEIAEANLGLIADSEVRGGAKEKEAAEFLMPPDSDKLDDEDEFDDSDDTLAAL